MCFPPFTFSFIQSFDVSNDTGTESESELTYKLSVQNIGSSLIQSAICHPPPPPLLLSGSGKASSGHRFTKSDISQFIATRGGVDEYLWQRIHNVEIAGLLNASNRFFLSDSVQISNPTLNSSSSSALYSPSPSNENTNTLKLGKRGRWYEDVWQEKDFLFSHLNKSRKVVHPMQQYNNWTECFNHYCDDHDGQYQRWMINKINSEKLASEITNQNFSSLPLPSPSSTNTDTALPSEIEIEIKDATERERINFFAPPVPTSMHHPAAWGPRPRQLINGDFVHKKYEHIHPAYDSTTIVCKSYTRSDADDVDELFLLAELTAKQYEAQTANNSLNLHRIIKLAQSGQSIEKLRAKRLALSENIFETFQSIIVRTSASFTIQVEDADHSMSSRRTSSRNLNGNGNGNGNLAPAQVSATTPMDMDVEDDRRYTTRAATGSLIRNKWAASDDDANSLYNSRCLKKAISDSLEETRKSTTFKHVGDSGEKVLQYDRFVKREEDATARLGACFNKHVPDFAFVKQLIEGDPTEVLLDTEWLFAVVVNRQVDDGLLLRHVKVRPLCSSVGEAFWVSVEDGRLSPVGTNLSLLAFKIASRCHFSANNVGPAWPRNKDSGSGCESDDEVVKVTI